MNRIDQLFKSKQKDILSIYFTAGFPTLDVTLDVAKYTEEAGADMIEVGIPFSDPVADGPTIQESNKKALDNGMTLKLLFEQLKDLRKDVSIPVILMGYINPIIQFGIEAFCAKCKEVGIDGLILPDLPITVYKEEYKSVFDKYGLKNTFLITPQTSEERIREIDEHSDGFIYMVSSASITGAKKKFGDAQGAYFDRVKKMGLKSPRLVGFGISNRETFEVACAQSNGAIIGSGFINVLANGKDLENDIKNYIKEIKG